MRVMLLLHIEKLGGFAYMTQNNNNLVNLSPAKASKSVDLPQPEGPIIAKSFLGL